MRREAISAHLPLLIGNHQHLAKQQESGVDVVSTELNKTDLRLKLLKAI